ncbi:MAG: hypothetical protein M3Y35_05035, partial [Actinomycetota bacterium]|nr:hypothetical protein [Actinomycetota bacterium]
VESAEGDTASDAAARLARAQEAEAEAEARKAQRRELIARNKQVPVDCTNLSVSADRWGWPAIRM